MMLRRKNYLTIAQKRSNPLSVVDSDEHPSHFKCPIKMSTMKEPVVAADGYTYEKSAIEEWFAHKLTSPLNGESLTSSSLIPNYNLRSQIQEWCDHNIVPSISSGTSNSSTAVQSDDKSNNTLLKSGARGKRRKYNK